MISLQDPSFHFSLAWSAELCNAAWIRKNFISVLNAKWKTVCSEDPSLALTIVDKIQFKTGNFVSEFMLPKVT